MKNIIPNTGKFLASRAAALETDSQLPAVYRDMAEAFRRGDIVEASIRIGMVINTESGERLNRVNYIRESLHETLSNIPPFREV